MQTAIGDADDGLPTPRRYFAAAGIILAIVMAVLDGAIVNIALPTIAEEMKVSSSMAIWVVNAYQLAVTVAILPAAALGQKLGYQRFYIVGLSLFVLCSVAAAMSRSFEALTIARGCQGLGAACVMSANGAMLRHTYPGSMLGRGLGLNSTFIAIATTGGPIVAGAILAVGSWRWLFAVNLPFGALAIVILLLSMPRTEPSPIRFDILNALLNAATFGLLVFAVANAGHGQRWTFTIAQIAGAAVAGALLVRRETGRRNPMLPLDLLGNRLFALSCATSICAFSAQALAFVSLPFFFHIALGKSAIEIGAMMAAWAMALGAAAPVAGRLADKHPAGLLGSVGLTVLALGLLSATLFSAETPVWRVVASMAVCGIGFGFFQTPNGRTMLIVGPKSRSGAAGAMISTARLLGQSIGAALAALIFGLSAPASEHLALFAGAAFALIGAGISLLRLRVDDGASIS